MRSSAELKKNGPARRMENRSVVASVLVLALLGTICVTGRTQTCRSWKVPESRSRSSSDLLTSKSAHTLGEMLLACSLLLDWRKQN